MQTAVCVFVDRVALIHYLTFSTTFLPCCVILVYTGVGPRYKGVPTHGQAQAVRLRDGEQEQLETLSYIILK